MDFYSDESSQTGHKYLVLGTLAIFRSEVPQILDTLKQIRIKYNHIGELGWSSVNSYKFQTYLDWVEAFAALVRPQKARFTALILNTSQVDNKQWNDGDSELGFSKLIYQLLLHRVGAPYGTRRPLDGYLDKRTTKHDPDNLREMLNAGLAKRYGIRTNPFRRLQFRDSKECDLIQLVDILTGAVAFFANGHATKPGTRKQKIQLCNEIRALRRADRLVRRQFDLWNFKYNDR